MYQAGDLVIYGNTGVCRVEGMSTPAFSADKSKLYYVLKPLYQDGTIYTPVENPKVFMRDVISREEAENLIDMIPTVDVKIYQTQSMQTLVSHYEEVIKSHDCEELLELVMSINTKKKLLEKQKRKFGAVDERFMKMGESLLFGELAIALGIDRKDVPDYIENRIEKEA